MKNVSIWTAIFRFIRTISLVECINLALTGVIGWKSGWTPLSEFGNGLLVAGIIAAGIGLFGIKGN